MKIAILHDYLNQCGGGEKCLDIFMKLFPHSDLYVLFYDSKTYTCSSLWNLKTSIIQRLPKLKNYKFYFPLFPIAIKLLNLDDYSLIFSSSHSYVKNLRKPNHSLHICYCHTPIRYAWDLRDQYLQQEPFFLRPFIKLFLLWLAYWDRKNSCNVDFFIANSKNVQQRILKYYGRDSEIIYPFVDCKKYTLSKKKEDFYLIVSRLIDAKRIDIAIQAFASSNRQLIIIGTGREQTKLAKSASSNITFLGYLPENDVIDYYKRAKALIVPGIEDFGMTSVEAQACGTPVIAFAKGGLLESIIQGKTGHFFHKQTPESLFHAIKEFETMFFNPTLCRKNALRFDKEIFKRKIKSFVIQKYRERRHD